MRSSGDGAVVVPLRPTVLIVENEALIAMMVEQTLAEVGYRTVWSRNGSSGLDGMEGLVGYAAAVVNLRLADGVDGRDVIRRLRARRAALPVVVMTGYVPHAPQADLRGLGGPTLRLGKPVATARLAEWLAAAVKSPQRPAERIRRRRFEDLVERRPEGR